MTVRKQTASTDKALGRVADSGLVLRAIYALCLLGATFNHATTIFKHGLFWDYDRVPWASAAFWTALTFIDPIAAVLLFLRPRLGITATATIIAVDVLHNSWMTWRIGELHGFHHGLNAYSNLAAQIAFLFFVAVTMRMLGQSCRARSANCKATAVDPLRTLA